MPRSLLSTLSSHTRLQHFLHRAFFPYFLHDYRVQLFNLRLQESRTPREKCCCRFYRLFNKVSSPFNARKKGAAFEPHHHHFRHVSTKQYAICKRNAKANRTASPDRRNGMHTQIRQRGFSFNAGQPHVPTSTKTRWLCANVPGTYNDEVMGINDSFPSLSGPIVASARSDSMNFCCAPLSCPSEFVRYSTSCKKEWR